MEKGRVLWSEIMSSGHANEAAHWLENYRFERYPELKKYLLIQYIYTVKLIYSHLYDADTRYNFSRIFVH